MAQLTEMEIRDLAFKTTGQRKNAGWMEARRGRLTASNFGKAISAMNNPHSTNIQRLREDIFNPRKLDNIPAIKWGTDHEAEAIDQYAKRMKVVVKPTGLWLFPNGVMGATPDALVFKAANDKVPVGIREVKCPYSIRNYPVGSFMEWHRHLKYPDCTGDLKRGTPYWHQVQGQMHAVNVEWCHFFIWTPHDCLTTQVEKDKYWLKEYFFPMEQFFKNPLARKEDCDEMEWKAFEADSLDDYPKFSNPQQSEISAI